MFHILLRKWETRRKRAALPGLQMGNAAARCIHGAASA
jgi:hypothetical protein